MNRDTHQLIDIKELKKASKLWCDKSVKSLLEDKLYYISPNIIWDNIYYESWPSIETLHKVNLYKKIYNNIKTNGWDKTYPAMINIGNKGEVYLGGGNHRINLIRDIELKFIPINFKYQKNIDPKTPVFTKDGDPYFPYGLIPTW